MKKTRKEEIIEISREKIVTFTDLIREIAYEMGEPIDVVHRVARSIFDSVAVAIEEKKSVRLKHIGTFMIKKGRARHYARVELINSSIKEVRKSDIANTIMGKKLYRYIFINEEARKYFVDQPNGFDAGILNILPEGLRIETIEWENITNIISTRYFGVSDTILKDILKMKYENGCICIVKREDFYGEASKLKFSHGKINEERITVVETC